MVKGLYRVQHKQGYPDGVFYFRACSPRLPRLPFLACWASESSSSKPANPPIASRLRLGGILNGQLLV